MNFLFQYSWAIVKKYCTVPFTMVGFDENRDHYAELWAANTLAQLEWAEHFGGAEIIMLGDSNVEFGNSADQMSKWKQVTVNAGKAGSRFDQLLEMLQSKSGQKILQYIQEYRIKVFLNDGGNHVLQGAMSIMESSASGVSSVLSLAPLIIAQDLPDINTPVLAPFYGEASEKMREDVRTANSIIVKYFPRTVQFGGFLMSLDDKDPAHMPGLTLSLKNIIGDGLVHYSPDFNKRHRYPFFSKMFAIQK